MNTSTEIYTFLDLMGTFVFALSGAVAAREKGLDIFGIFAIAFIVACGGGIIRDLCISAIPPVGLTNVLYLMMVFAATLLVIVFYQVISILKHPVLLFDALGLSVFTVSGASKVIDFGHNYELAIFLGTVTAVGGGVIRDMLLSRIPVILKKEIYASAAMLGAAIVVAGDYLSIPKEIASTGAIVICFGLRFSGLYFHLNLPSFRGNESEDADKQQ